MPARRGPEVGQQAGYAGFEKVTHHLTLVAVVATNFC